MYSSNQSTNVVLFPLCDVHGVLIDTLCDTSDAPNTRADALVFAWRLALPKGMDVTHAAEALLVVALNTPHKTWSDQQLLLVRELMALAGRTPTVPGIARVNRAKALVSRPRRRTRDFKVDHDLASDRDAFDEISKLDPQSFADSSAGKPSKESKKWWKLVGKYSQRAHSEQRKTRNQRVSREP